jgi:hypothetical protein
MRRLLLALLVILTISCLLSGQTTNPVTVPPLIKFSGMLPGAQGTVGVTFAFYANQSGGAPLWLETQNVTPNANGYYTVYLGVTKVGGVPLELFASGQALWLGIQPAGQAEEPRILLASVPYALKAADADTLAGLPVSAFLQASGGNSAATAKSNTTTSNVLALTTPATSAGSDPPVTTSTGSTNYVAKFFDTNGTIGNSLIFDNGTYVGIGTNSPLAGLHVVAPAVTTTNPGMLVDVYHNGKLGAVPVIYRAARGTPSSPSGVQSGDIIGGMSGRAYFTSQTSGVNSGFSSGGKAGIVFYANENWTDQAQSTYLSFFTTSSGGINQTEKMRLDNAGNLGIGTISPTSPLTVAGKIQSTAGGFVFPDNSLQTTAAVSGITLTSPDGSVAIGGTAIAPTVAVNPVVLQAAIGAGGTAVSVPVIVAQTSFTGTTGLGNPQGACNAGAGGCAIYTPTTSGFYRVTVYMNTPTLGTCGTPPCTGEMITLQWNDGVSAAAQNTVSCNLVTPCSSSAVIPMWVANGQTISAYGQTTGNGATPAGGSYTAYVLVERLQH